MSSLIAGTGSAQGHGFSVERHAGMPRPQSNSKTKQIGAVSYRKRSIETQTAVSACALSYTSRGFHIRGHYTSSTTRKWRGEKILSAVIVIGQPRVKRSVSQHTTTMGCVQLWIIHKRLDISQRSCCGSSPRIEVWGFGNTNSSTILFLITS